MVKYYAALITALCALCVWGCFGLTRHIIAAVDRWGNAAPDLAQTVDAINRPCGGGRPCGLLANVNKTFAKVGDAIVTTQLQERAITPHTVSAMDTFKDAATRLGGTADALTGTANAGTETLQEATSTLGEGKRAIAAMPPLLDAYTRSGNDLDALLASKSLSDALDNLRDTTKSMAGVSNNLDLISGDFHHWEQPFMNPVPCKQTKHPERCKWGRIGKGIGAATVFTGRVGQTALPIVMR